MKKKFQEKSQLSDEDTNQNLENPQRQDDTEEDDSLDGGEYGYPHDIRRDFRDDDDDSSENPGFQRDDEFKMDKEDSPEGR